MKKSQKLASGKSSVLSLERQKVAGIDIGNSAHYVTVAAELCSENVRKFGTFTADLESLADWLLGLGIESVAMESTGIYWIPIFEILESRGLEVLLVNARYPKHVSGRKSDVSDSGWIQQLHSYGLLPSSFIPSAEVRELRYYVRQRSSLISHKAQYLQRIGKSLQLMNIKLQNKIARLDTQIGMSIIRAIVAGERDPKKLAEFHRKALKASKEELTASLKGNYRKEHLFALKQSLCSFDFIKSQIQECDLEIEKILQKWQTGQEVSQEKFERQAKKKSPSE